MPLQSDLALNAAQFNPNAVSAESKEFNAKVMEAAASMPRWYEVGAEKYRQMRWNNETSIPRPPLLASGKNETIPSREAGRDITIRIFAPENAKTKGVFLHIHGGGWVLQSELYQDNFLNFMAQKASLTVVSIGYRLAPEHPFPAGPEDCYDAAEYLVQHSESRFGAPLLFTGGESAGAHLALLTMRHLSAATPTFHFRALLLHFGAYNLADWFPSTFAMPDAPVLTLPVLDAFRDAFVPGSTVAARRDPAISPFHADWRAVATALGGLPPALFTCGTADPLLDDSVLMAAKWQMAGGDGVLKIYPGAPHGFIGFDFPMAEARQGMADLEEYLLEKGG